MGAEAQIQILFTGIPGKEINRLTYVLKKTPSLPPWGKHVPCHTIGRIRRTHIFGPECPLVNRVAEVNEQQNL